MRLFNPQPQFISKKMQFASVAVIGVFLLAFSSSPPIGNTGAPGDGDCGNCHGGGNFPGSITWTWSSDPQPEFFAEFITGVANEFGYQMTILDDNDNPIGTYSSTPSNSSVKTSGGQEWLGHDPSVFSSTGLFATEGIWDPQGYTGDLTVYLAINATNGNGNTGGDDVHLFEFEETIVGTSSPIVLTIDEIQEIECNGVCIGELMANVSGGVAPFEYDWSDGQSTETATGLCAGSYTVTVTDDNGDTEVASIAIMEPDAIGFNIDFEDAGCFGESNGSIELDVFGGTPGYDFDWDNFGNTCCISQLSAGTYEVTITDDNGCELIESITIFENPQITLSTSTTMATSGGANGSATVAATGGSGGFDYNWSNGGDTPSITGLAAGTYTVTVTDNENCEAMATVMVSSQVCNLSLITTSIDANCYGEQGSIIASTLGATPPVSFAWSDGTQSSVLSNVAGTYSVTATDNAGCVVDVSGLVLSQPDSLDVILTSVTSAACAGGSGGGLTVSVIGGVGDYTLTWEGTITNDTLINGLDTLVNIPDTLSNLNAGYFSYVLIDGNGCSRMDSFLIPGDDVIPPVLTTQTAFIYLDEMGVAGPVDVDAIVDTATDNCGIMSLEIINNPTEYTCADIGSVILSVTATDTNNNMATETALVTVLDTIAPQLICPQSFVVSSCMAIDYDIPISTDNCDGNLMAVLVSGLSPGSVFPAGTTTVLYEATDLCNNTGNCSFDITVNVDLELSALSSPATCGLMDGTITLLAAGGTPPYVFTPDLSTGVAAGDYNITVTDAGGCSAETNVVVEQIGGPEISGISAISFCPGTIPLGNLEVNGGESPYNILIDGQAVSNAAGPLIEYMLSGAGTFNVTLVDANGCASNTLDVTAAEFEIIPVTVADVNLGCAANIPASQVQLPPGYSLQGNPSTLSPGTFTIVDNLCGVPSGTVTITGGGMLTVEATTTPTRCNGATGSVSVVATGGVEPYTYAPFGPDQAGLGAGNYTINVTDATGCTASVEVTIVQEDGPSITVQESIACFGATGELEITGTGGMTPYSYQLGAGNPVEGNGTEPFTFDNLVPGSYVVRIIDANGCSSELPAVVREHPELIVMTEADPGLDCMLSVDELIVSPMGGVMPYDIVTEVEADSMAILVTIVDGVGCSVTERIILTELEELQASATVNYACEDSNPLVSITSIGGCLPHTNDFDQTINTQVGDHIITVTDNAGNSTQVTITIEDIGVLSLMAPAQVTIMSGDPASIDPEVAGGIAPYAFQWLDVDNNILSEEQILDVSNLESQILTVVVIDSRGCAASMDVDLTVLTATIDLDDSDRAVQVYPSPVVDELTINMTEPAPAQITMLDMTGQVVTNQKTEVATTRMDVSDFAPGVYLIRMEFEDRIILKRFIKS